MSSSIGPVKGIDSDPIGTVRRHLDMIAVKQTTYQWLIVHADRNVSTLLTEQRIEEIADRWPLVHPGTT